LGTATASVALSHNAGRNAASASVSPRSAAVANREIAERMFLAEKTIKNDVSSLLAKLGLERRTQAAVLASRLLGKR
jgi:DNA-binding NarL/FixJ family response regulator